MKKLFKWDVTRKNRTTWMIRCMGTVVFRGERDACEEMAAAHNAQIDMFESQLLELDSRG